MYTAAIEESLLFINIIRVRALNLSATVHLVNMIDQLDCEAYIPMYLGKFESGEVENRNMTMTNGKQLEPYLLALYLKS